MKKLLHTLFIIVALSGVPVYTQYAQSETTSSETTAIDAQDKAWKIQLAQKIALGLGGLTIAGLIAYIVWNKLKGKNSSELDSFNNKKETKKKKYSRKTNPSKLPEDRIDEVEKLDRLAGLTKKQEPKTDGIPDELSSSDESSIDSQLKEENERKSQAKQAELDQALKELEEYVAEQEACHAKEQRLAQRKQEAQQRREQEQQRRKQHRTQELLDRLDQDIRNHQELADARSKESDAKIAEWNQRRKQENDAALAQSLELMKLMGEGKLDSEELESRMNELEQQDAELRQRRQNELEALKKQLSQQKVG